MNKLVNPTAQTLRGSRLMLARAVGLSVVLAMSPLLLSLVCNLLAQLPMPT
jgi:hypothetical protein